MLHARSCPFLEGAIRVGGARLVVEQRTPSVSNGFKRNHPSTLSQVGSGVNSQRRLAERSERGYQTEEQRN